MNTIIQGQIEEINQKMTDMSGKVISAIKESVDALVDQDLKKAKLIKKEDKIVNSIRWEIEVHQPDCNTAAGRF